MKAARVAAGRTGDKPTTGKIVRVVDRAIAVLDCFDAEHTSLTLAELSRRMALPKPTVFRIALALARNGLLEQYDAAYALGGAIHRHAETLLGSMPLRMAALPTMEKLRDEINETVILSVRDAFHRYNIDSVESTHAIGQTQQIGVPIPLYAGAASRVMLAALTDDDLELYLKSVSLKAFSASTITDLDALRAAVRAVRKAGYASTGGEYTRGSHAIASLIETPASLPMAALHVSIPPARYSVTLEGRISKRLRASVRDIASRLDAAP